MGMRRHLSLLRVLPSLLTLSAFVPVPALAHGEGEAVPDLHVGSDYDNCYFDLHPELSQGELHTFTAEAASVTRFQQLQAPAGLPGGDWSLSMAMSVTPIDDSKGAWNDTFSHPEDDHWLGDDVRFPRLVVRRGLTEHVQVGAWGTANPSSNYGFAGLDAMISWSVGREGGLPVDVAVRPSATTMLGPDELWAGNAGLDATAGLTWKGLSPYVGVGGTLGVAVERTDEVDLAPSVTLAPVAVTGVTWRVWHVRLGAEATWSNVQTFGVTAGAEL